MIIKKYRKKPVVIEAARLYKGMGLPAAKALSRWCGGNLFAGDEWLITIPTLEGEMQAGQGDYIIKGVADEFYPCKSDIFAATYEEVTA